jgi:outer membrane protein assembly factor BamA
MKRALALVCIAISSWMSLEAGATPVSEVRVMGVPSDLSDSVKNISGILPGDEYEKIRVERGKEKIQEYLESKGYPQATVDLENISESGEHILEFKIILGPPIRIADATFQSKDAKISQTLTTKLSQAIDLKPGELFDRDRIKEMRRSVETVLFAQNFIDSRINDLTTEVTSDGLRITFWLEIGQNVVLSVSGNNYFSRSELMTFIDEQRTLGLGQDYINVLVGRIREHYIDHGFRSIVVTPYSFEAHGNEAKKVVFDVQEGEQVHIKNLIFDGNETFKDSELTTFFYNNAADRIVAKIYNAKMVEDAAKA